jgi:hypothetical protein
MIEMTLCAMCYVVGYSILMLALHMVVGMLLHGMPLMVIGMLLHGIPLMVD